MKVDDKSKKTIMIVDDDADIVDSVKTVLAREGYKILTAVNGDDALKKIKSGKKPDLILMDIMMPGTPATIIVPKFAPIKVAYLSVLRTSGSERNDYMRFSNVVDFIQKPFDVEGKGGGF
ncbi:MAG: response regulator [archaeon]